MAKRVVPPAPTVDEVKSRLGPTFPLYEGWLRSHGDLRPEWKYYGAKSGWSLKLFDGKRNLCFVLPKDGSFAVAFVLGASATETVLASDVPDAVKGELREARAYAEGRGVRITVNEEADLRVADRLLSIKRGR